MRSDRLRPAFTMIETIVVIIILAILGTTVSALFNETFDVWMNTARQSEVSAEASIALDRMVREIREIPLDPGAPSPQPYVNEASRSTIVWRNGYRLERTGDEIIMMATGPAPSIVVRDVTDLQFDFLDDEGRSLLMGTSVPPADLPNIRRVSVRITLTRASHEVTLHTRVFIRSMVAASGP